ncbi:MAG: class II fructose-bisphosphatase [Alphaproteobacteria bacterium]|nr:class II fructose-bisphosphatase [Alphaproteobacteria bacterium]
MITPLSSQIAEVAELAAIACYDWIGKGDNKAADAAAVKSMRENLNRMNIAGTVVIGEGERDEAPMLFIGEEVGKGGVEVDIALDPLEGTTICANAGESSLAVIAFAKKGGFLHAPDVYMDKIAVGAGLPIGIIDLDNSPKKNLQNIAQAKKCDISDLTVMILERPRHQELIAKVREAGARIRLIGDGDVAGVIACTSQNTRVDAYMGSGGAPEGVLAAAALRVIGGQMMGRLVFGDNQRQIERAKKMGIADLNKKYTTEEMAKGDVIFACAGVTDGYMLEGVKKCKKSGKVFVSSLLMDSAAKKVVRTRSEYLCQNN